MSDGYDVWLLAGQSNSVGNGHSFDADLDTPHPRIFQRSTGGSNAGLIVPANDPLTHISTTMTGLIGPWMTFARALINDLPADRKILLCPQAINGSSFHAGHWQANSGTYFQQAVAAANAALALDPADRFAGILWCQGESDYVMPGTEYRDALETMIAAMRAQIFGAAAAPFIALGMVPEYAALPQYAQVNSAHMQLPERVVRTAFVPGASGNADPVPYHYDAPTQRKNGQNVHLGYYAALANTPPKGRTSKRRDVVNASERFAADVVRYIR